MSRKPKIAAPPGHRGCPRCEQVLPLFDSQGNAMFRANGYCVPCGREIRSNDKQRRRLALIGAAAQLPATASPQSGPGRPDTIVRTQQQTQSLARAQIAPFPAVRAVPRCTCCHRAPTQNVAGLPFCERCGYYVAACGRCVDHSFREFVPELRHNPDPPELPFVATAPVPPYAGKKTRAPGADELDLIKHP